jgi:hypothetical protein
MLTRKETTEHADRFSQQDWLAASIRTSLALTGPIGPIIAEFLTQFVPGAERTISSGGFSHSERTITTGWFPNGDHALEPIW